MSYETEGESQDERELKRDVAVSAVGQVLMAPITWVPFIPAMAAVALLPMPWWAEAATLAVPAAIVATSWAAYWPRLTQVLRAKAKYERTINAQQEMGKLENALRLNHMHREASIMVMADELVTQIAALNANNANDQSLRIEALAQRVLDQMRADARAALKPGAPEGTLPRLEASLQTLRESCATVEKQVGLLKKMAAPQQRDRLGELRDQLKSENSIAENVMNRLESDTQNQ
ncbi:hypothetical protein DB346_12930 [Verrucomicrobia bacterium LW23]|nr:hypothetical protein DB346_12930 [Verrucomicrobia bacterium LW23]